MKHITVTPAEDDEVIVVGAEPARETTREPAYETTREPARETTRETTDETTRETTDEKPERHPKPDEYHETTLEDLQSTSMPLAQKIVIIAAVICIIGALVYYFLLMR